MLALCEHGVANVISSKTIRGYAALHADAAEELFKWNKAASHAVWRDIQHVRQHCFFANGLSSTCESVVLWDQRERGEEPNLDRGLGLCAGRHRPQAARAGGEPLSNSTDFERDAFRENAHFTRISFVRQIFVA
jgi:hypothetical protein